jgi:MFS family permease
MCLGYASYNYTFYLLLFWLPTFISTALHTTPVRAALLSSIPWILATAAELFVGGLLVDKLIERGWNGDRVRRFVLIVGTSMGLGLVGATTTSRIPVALVWITIAIGGLSAASAIGWSIPSLLAPKESVGTLGGILNTCNQMSALAAGMVTGFIVAHHSFAPAMGVAAVYLAIGIAGYIFLLGRIEQLPEPPKRTGVVSAGAAL